MPNDKLLTEVERQKAYLDRLPNDYTYPLFNSKQALESQRRNGYRDTAAASREIVDNAIESGAKNIQIIFQRARDIGELKAHQRKDGVIAMAVIDDGPGMLPEMARFALSWGGGTHSDEPEFIGKFGFGLPNASINQTRRVEVYTKTSDAKNISMTFLDATDVSEHGVQTIPAATDAKLPDFVRDYMKRNSIPFGSGTVVVWRNPDRLTYNTAATLKEHLVDDFSVTYRYLLNNFNLIVDGLRVEPVDPLFLTPGARYFVPEEEGGARLMNEQSIPVRYFRDSETNSTHLEVVENKTDLDDPTKEVIAIGNIYYRIGRLPYGFAVSKKGKAETDAHRRFEVRKSRRGMSFVRAGREIETVDAFPRSARDVSSGLGEWPLLQGYAYHWGVEVRFETELDEVFGITNDKQTVRPIEDFWRILVGRDIEVDAQLHRENAWQRENRKKEETPKAETSDSPTDAEMAAAGADTASGRKPAVPDHSKADVKNKSDEQAETEAAKTGKPLDEVKKAIDDAAKKRPYKIDYFADPNGPFFQPVWNTSNQILVRINTSHPFYSNLYAETLRSENSKALKHGVDVLLITLARSELTATDPQTKITFEHQRKDVWSPFLRSSLKLLDVNSKQVEDDYIDEGND